MYVLQVSIDVLQVFMYVLQVFFENKHPPTCVVDGCIFVKIFPSASVKAVLNSCSLPRPVQQPEQLSRK